MTNGANAFNWLKVAIGIFLAVAIGWILYKFLDVAKKAASTAVDAAKAAANFVTGGSNDNNFVSRGVDHLLGIDRSQDSLGTVIHSWFNRDPTEETKRIELEINPLPYVGDLPLADAPYYPDFPIDSAIGVPETPVYYYNPYPSRR